MRKLKIYFCLLALAFFGCGEGGEDFSPGAGTGTGTAGSFASFVVADNYLYAINGESIKTFELLPGGGMAFTNQIDLSATLETVFPYGSLLLVGSQQGVFFLDRSTPSAPEYLSVYSHITSCDPVVARDNVAYSTLRSTRCRFGNTDQLDVIDFSDLSNPQVIRSYEAVEPLGLGLRGNFLFLCENQGLSMYNVSDPANLSLMDQISFDGAIAIDVIPADQYLVVTTNRGIYNVQFTDLGEMRVIGQVTSN